MDNSFAVLKKTPNFERGKHEIRLSIWRWKMEMKREYLEQQKNIKRGYLATLLFGEYDPYKSTKEYQGWGFYTYNKYRDERLDRMLQLEVMYLLSEEEQVYLSRDDIRFLNLYHALDGS